MLNLPEDHPETKAERRQRRKRKKMPVHGAGNRVLQRVIVERSRKAQCHKET